MAEFDAASAFREAHERHEHGTAGSAPWIPIAAAVLALLAAICGLTGGLRATQSNAVKGEAIILTTKAADTYNLYESRSIKQHIYEAAVAAGNARDPGKLAVVADHERIEKTPLLAKAHRYEEQAEADERRSEQLLISHEILEIGTTLFEVAIVLVSVSALAAARFLPLAAALFAGAGAVVGLIGAFR